MGKKVDALRADLLTFLAEISDPESGIDDDCFDSLITELCQIIDSNDK